VTSEAVNAAGVEVIVSNALDFAASAIPAALPEEFLAKPWK